MVVMEYPVVGTCPRCGGTLVQYDKNWQKCANARNCGYSRRTPTPKKAWAVEVMKVFPRPINPVEAKTNDTPEANGQAPPDSDT